MKTAIKWNDNGTVTYKNLRWYVFEPDMSPGTEEDVIYSVNLPFVVRVLLLKVSIQNSVI